MTLKFIIIIFIANVITAERSNPMVVVPYGVIRGTWKVSTKGRSYASFEGIPYARPPIGKYRFREPQPLKSWTGVWNATKHPSACLQYNALNAAITDVITGSEDCLYLNVYSPRLQSNALLPVLVFIHGGAFMLGEGPPNGAANIMDWDMVVVTLNYRLGPLGFLSTGDKVVPGNNGLKDQSFALHWTKNNILMFGGNPDSITLAGISAGGASVHYHYLSPMSRGTFARGIAFSGSALNPWTFSIRPAEKARTLASIVDCPTNSSKEMVDCLRKQPGEVIIKAQIAMFDWQPSFSKFTPCVEAPGVQGAFLQWDPYHATKNGFMRKLPLIATDASEEGLDPAAAYQADPTILPDLEAHWNQLADNIFEYSDTLPVTRRREVAQTIKQHYLGGKPVSQKTFSKLVQALGDRLFNVGVGKMAQFHAAKSGQPTYVYRFAYRGSQSLSNILAHNNVDYGVSHADDTFWIFNLFKPETEGDVAITDVLINMIYNFCTFGTPTRPEDGPAWLPVRPGAKELDYLDILAPNKLVMKSVTNYGQKHFWDKLGFNEGENCEE